MRVDRMMKREKEGERGERESQIDIERRSFIPLYA
jgi:hypothetical protein